MEIINDIICQVYAGQKSKETIELVLNTFIPGYEHLNSEYACKPDGTSSDFKTEEEMIAYFIDNTGLTQAFFWNKYHDNPDKIMVGANITADDKLIVSLTIDGNKETEMIYFNKLKELLKSDVGIVSYVNPTNYENGEEFITKYA